MKPYLELVTQIRDAVRKKAQEVPVFKETGNGAIRILAYPLCQEADEWLGGLSDFSDPEEPDIVDYEHTFAISAGGSRVIEAFWSPNKERVDCYAVSAMKIAHCSHAQDIGAGLVSGIDLGDPYLTEDKGYGPYKGAVCVEVWKLNQLAEPQEISLYERYCGIYVCVSGADSGDDLECAKAGIEAICEFFSESVRYPFKPNFKLTIPNYGILD